MRITALFSVLCLLLAAGCTTVRRAPPTPSSAPPAAPTRAAEPPTTPAAAPAPVQALPPGAPASPVTPAPASPAAEIAGQLTMLVESAPPGAIIVMDGRPVGKAPVRVVVPVTPLGFFENYVEVRARFVATDETEVSRTAVEEFSPREKVPAVLHFTPDGAQRAVR
jgi:cytoskeletal protein RodZ